MTWPDPDGVHHEVLQLIGAAREIRPRRCRTLLRVTRPTRGDEIPLRLISAAHPGLNVIEGEQLTRQDLAAVDTAISIACQDALTQGPRLRPGTFQGPSTSGFVRTS